MSINDRINPSGRTPLNPVLRWAKGRPETIRIESGLLPAMPEENEMEYEDPFAVWGDDGTVDMLDRPITDAEWTSLLGVIIA